MNKVEQYRSKIILDLLSDQEPWTTVEFTEVFNCRIRAIQLLMVKLESEGLIRKINTRPGYVHRRGHPPTFWIINGRKITAGTTTNN